MSDDHLRHLQQGMDDIATLWDLNREIRKTMRRALVGVTTLAGRTDAADADADALSRLLDAWRRVASALDDRRHEERCFAPLVHRHAPAPSAELEAAQRRTDADIARLHRFAKGHAKPMRAGVARGCARPSRVWAASCRSAWRVCAMRASARCWR